MIRVLIVDDSTIILSALSNLLRLYSDIEVIGLAGDGLKAVGRTLENSSPTWSLWMSRCQTSTDWRPRNVSSRLFLPRASCFSVDPMIT